MKEVTQKARELDSANEWITFSTGVRGKIVPVAPSLIDEVQNSLKNPKVPVFYNEEKGRDEENPNHPDYISELEEVNRKRLRAALETMIMFGVQLEAMPDNDEWVSRLKFLEKRGHINLSEYDLDDPLDKEFLYKKFVAVGTIDLVEVGRSAGLNAADVGEAAKSFQS